MITHTHTQIRQQQAGYILILFAYTVHFLNRVFTDLILGFGINVPIMVDIIAIQKLDITPLGSTLRLMQANRNSDSARMACTMNSPILMSASFKLFYCTGSFRVNASVFWKGFRHLHKTSPLPSIVCIFCTCYQPGPCLLGCHSLNSHHRSSHS